MEQKSKKEESESVQLKNPNISHMKMDFLYHLGLGNETHNLPKMFGDVKVSLYDCASKSFTTLLYLINSSL